MLLSNVNFEGKTVVVTGGTQGIGFATASQCVALGGKVILVARNKEKSELACEKLGKENASYYLCDLGNTEDVQRTFNRIVEENKVDVLINNAGVINTDEFVDVTLEDWNKVINTNLTATFVTCQVVFKAMEANGGGRIVNVASVAGMVGGGYLGTAAYAASKAGVICLTKSVAKAGAGKNIYCNSICPSYTKTPMVTGKLVGEKEAAVIKSINLHRAAEPNEVASSILFLASDAASFVQGENLNCDGGLLMNG